MKKHLSILITFLTLAVTGWSQQLQQYKYGLYDNYFVNPAYVGNNEYYSLLLANDTKFSGLKDASPRTYVIGLHSRVGRGYMFEKSGKINKFFSKFGNAAFGFQGLMYNYGPQNEYNFGLTYGYHLDLAPNINTKLPRKLVFALTPRLLILNFDRSKFVDNEGVLLTSLNDPIFPSDLGDKMFHMNFKCDVGALFQSSYYDLGISWLNFTNSRNGFENDTISYGRRTVQVNDTVSKVTGGYNIYDSIYSSLIVLNGKIKFLSLVETDRYDVNFIPDLTFVYRPNAKDFEVYANLKLDWNLYDVTTTSRKELKYNLQGGVNIVYTRYYRDIIALQPYISFDFLNFKIQYIYQFNPNLRIPGYWGRNQITFLYALGREKVFRASDRSRMPFRRR
jgi:hypothetical protein